MTEERDPYQILGVSPDASDDEIRKAYHARARRLHPDVVGESGLDEMRHLNQAWSLLKDPDKRAALDTSLGRVPRRQAPGSDASSGSESSRGDDRRSAASKRDFAGQPAWTGAAGTPPGRPWGTVLQFGIYAGWSLGEIARRDRGYLAWLRDKPEAKQMRQEIEQLLESTAPPQDSGGRSRKRG